MAAPIGRVSKRYLNQFGKAPVGTKLNCKAWSIEAAYRLLNNNLDPAVAEHPKALIVYGGIGRAVRNWACYDAILDCLVRLETNRTLLIQSGKPVGIFKTHSRAPRVLIANSNLVGHWANWEHFRTLEEAGLMMYGQMTAGSWSYIGTQGILQGTYETFAALARKHFDGSLKHRIVLTAGLGGMGGAQPLAITMNGGVALCVEVDRSRIRKRIESGYLMTWTASLEKALQQAAAARAEGTALSIGLLGNAAEIHPLLVEKKFKPDVVTDQTGAHDELNGYYPAGYTLQEALKLRRNDPQTYIARSRQSMVVHVKAMLALQAGGGIAFDYGNNIRAQAKTHGGLNEAFDIPGFVPEYIRPLFCEGRGPFRWIALSGDPQDIYYTDALLLKMFRRNRALCRWIELAREQVKFQGLPARVCWLGYGERDKFALALNRVVREGKIEAPIVVTRDHLDCGSVASPNRETEAMCDGSDAIADWPILNALLNTAAGADIVSFHHGGGVGMGYSLHTNCHVVLDGSRLAQQKASAVFKTDPGMGVLRHADAGYPEALRFALAHGIEIPLSGAKRYG